MKPHPYLLHPALLPAALAGRLTQLWVPCKQEPQLARLPSRRLMWPDEWTADELAWWIKTFCPYLVGTRLFCKEAWFDNRSINGDTDSEVLYRADGEIHQQEECVDGFTGWRPARSMPAWAARIWFEVVSVAMRRAESVTHRECCESGWPGYEKTSGDLTYNERDWIITTGDGDDACIEWFADLYDRQHGPGSFERDWCWVYVVKAIGVSE